MENEKIYFSSIIEKNLSFKRTHVLMLLRTYRRIRIHRFSLLVSYFIDISKNGFANVGRDVRLRDSVIRFSPANERDIPLPFPSFRLRPSFCGSCIIRLSLLNPRSNLKSEEKLDSLIGRERKPRLGRREPLIKSYRLSSPFTLPKSSDRKFSPRKEPQTFLFPSLSVYATPFILFSTVVSARP